MAGEQPTSTDEDANLSSLASSASLVLIGSLFGSASKLIEQFIVAYALSTEAYGKVNVALSIMTLSTVVALVGLDQGIPRFISRFDDERDKRGIWLVGLIISGTIAVVFTIVLVLARKQLLSYFESGTSVLFLVLFVLSIPFLVGLRVGVGAIRGSENTIYRTYAYDLLYNGLRLGVLVALLVAGLGILAAGYAYLVATVVAFIVVHALLRRLFALRGQYRTHTRKLVRFSAPLVIAASVSTLLARIDVIMIEYFMSSEAAGIYSYGYTLAAGIPVVLSVFGFLYLPLASRLDDDDDHEEVDHVYKVTTKWIYIAAFPMLLTFVAFTSDLVSVFSEATPASAAVLAILSIGFFLSAANGRCQDTLSAFGYTRSILVINVIAAVLNIVLNVVLIQFYGVVGAAIASALSFIALNGIAMVVLWRTSRISPFSRVTVKTFLLLPIVLFPPALLLSRVISLPLFALPVFGIVAGLFTVALVAVTGCLQPEDEIPIELVEDRLGVRIPLIRRYIPSRES